MRSMTRQRMLDAERPTVRAMIEPWLREPCGVARHHHAGYEVLVERVVCVFSDRQIAARDSLRSPGGCSCRRRGRGSCAVSRRRWDFSGPAISGAGIPMLLLGLGLRSDHIGQVLTAIHRNIVSVRQHAWTIGATLIGDLECVVYVILVGHRAFDDLGDLLAAP
jgi:hypothetical protein